MSVTVTYDILFEVKLLHHYFLNKGSGNYEQMNDDAKAEMMLKYDVRDFLDITPTAECRKNLERHRCIFKKTSTGIIVGLKACPDELTPGKNRPCLDLDADLAFTFHISLIDFNLMNYTALPFTGNSGNVYVFQNIKGASGKLFPGLSAVPPTYAAGTQYLPGDMVADDAASPTTLFTATRKTVSPTTTVADWQSENSSDGLPMCYANSLDRHQLVRQILSYRVKTAGVNPEISLKTASGQSVTPGSVTLPGEFSTIQVDLREFPEGFYSMHAQSADLTYQDDITFYLLQSREAPFAVLRLSVKSDTAAYDMLDPQGDLLSPVYELRFRNRATHWRYVGRQFDANAVTDEPMPLTRFGFIEHVSVPDKDGNPVDDLQNPEVVMIKAEALTVTAEKKFYSEIHIH
ncbi:MAG: hypothetical protein HGB22_00180 [Chlorobiaceae bacterium]|nr:hypothetical protein [Chlorobiaceae bacterium]